MNNSLSFSSSYLISFLSSHSSFLASSYYFLFLFRNSWMSLESWILKLFMEKSKSMSVLFLSILSLNMAPHFSSS